MTSDWATGDEWCRSTVSLSPGPSVGPSVSLSVCLSVGRCICLSVSQGGGEACRRAGVQAGGWQACGCEGRARSSPSHGCEVGRERCASCLVILAALSSSTRQGRRCYRSRCPLVVKCTADYRCALALGSVRWHGDTKIRWSRGCSMLFVVCQVMHVRSSIYAVNRQR